MSSSITLYNVRTWSTLDLPPIELAWPLALTPLIYAHQIFKAKPIKFANDYAEHYGHVIPQGVSFTIFEGHLNNVGSPLSQETLFAH